MQCADCPLGYGWYEPSQGQLFDDEKRAKPCPIAFVQLNYNYDQLKAGNEQLREAMNVLVKEDGTCQTRELLLQVRREAEQ